MRAPGLGASQRAVLEAIKRLGVASAPALSAALGLNVETLRSHLRALEGHALVRREPSRRSGRGRPEVVYGLTAEGEALFPRREGEVLQALVSHLRRGGQEALLDGFFEQYIGTRRGASLARVAHLEGRARLEESARILTELGFMAEVVETGGPPRLRLCNCPLRDLVQVTKIPCRVEVAFVRELLGEELTRVSYIPAGASSCSYEVDA